MTTNDVLKKLRFAARLQDAAMLEMLALAGSPVGKETLDSWFRKDDEAGYAECPRGSLAALLDGMILKYRGPRDASAGPAQRAVSAPLAEPLDNNLILKKLRIAFELKEEDLVAIMKRAGVDVSRNELSALFRKKGQRNYVECMDQFLRNFLAGLSGYRKGAGAGGTAGN